jgi:4-hydroxy-3-methylbut-2-enyl diphosphate reductase
MQVLLAKPRGFCAGVDRAIQIVERALQIHGAPIYMRHEVVHNKVVTDDGRSKGAAKPRRGLKVFDAICPLVAKVHVEVAKMREQGREIIVRGDHGHPEVEGTMGQSQGMYLVETPADVTRLKVGDESNLAFVTQTTLSVDDASGIIAALKAPFPKIAGPKTDDIRYATQNRQDAIKALAQQCDVVIVVGSPNSANSNRLREVAANQGVTA